MNKFPYKLTAFVGLWFTPETVENEPGTGRQRQSARTEHYRFEFRESFEFRCEVYLFKDSVGTQTDIFNQYYNTIQT